MDITIVVCTYNRSQQLLSCLESIAGSTLPSGMEWEVIVIDNNSTDQTRRVVGQVCRRYPGRFRYVFEREQGLSRARNRGIREAQGNIIVFTDDDVTVEATWLATLTNALHREHWIGAGGRVVPVWRNTPPRWLPATERYSLAPLAVVDFPKEAGDLSESPVGANMAFKRGAFDVYGLFRTDLGRCGSNLISNEECEFAERLLTRGERLRYEPTAVVYHPVPESRLQKTYFLSWWFAKGRAEIRQSGVRPQAKHYCCGMPLYLGRSLLLYALRWMMTFGTRARFEQRLKVWAVSGQIRECYAISRPRPDDRIDAMLSKDPVESHGRARS